MRAGVVPVFPDQFIQPVARDTAAGFVDQAYSFVPVDGEDDHAGDAQVVLGAQLLFAQPVFVLTMLYDIAELVGVSLDELVLEGLQEFELRVDVPDEDGAAPRRR